MMQSEFTELTKIYVTAGQYAEIEKRYMEMNISKQEFCKLYKANKDGIQEACARDASMNEWKEKDELKKESKNLNKQLDALNEEHETLRRMWNNERNASSESINAWIRERNKEFERANEAEQKVEALEQEIIKLKAKLYDMMMNGAA